MKTQKKSGVDIVVPDKIRSGSKERIIKWFLARVLSVRKEFSEPTLIFFKISGVSGIGMKKLIVDVVERDKKLKTASMVFKHLQSKDNTGIFWNMYSYVLLECNKAQLKNLLGRYWFEPERRCEIIFMRPNQIYTVKKWEDDRNEIYDIQKVLPFIKGLIDNNEHGFESTVHISGK